MEGKEIQLNKAKEVLSIELFQKIFRNSKDDSKIEVLNVRVEIATCTGDNHTSNMFRTFVEFGKGELTKKEQFIVKFVPILEGQFRDFVSYFFEKCTNFHENCEKH